MASQGTIPAMHPKAKGSVDGAFDAVHRPTSAVAAGPALFMGLGGLLTAFDNSLRPALNRGWPPALLVLVIWMFIRRIASSIAKADSGGSTQYWRCWLLPPSAAATRPCGNTPSPTPTR